LAAKGAELLTVCFNKSASEDAQQKCLLGLDTYQGMLLNEVISGSGVDTEITVPGLDINKL
jgi:hypothetical protein